MFWGKRVSRLLSFVQEWVFPFWWNTPFISLFDCWIITDLTYTTSGRSQCIYSPFLMFSDRWLRRVQETGQFQGVSGPGTFSQLLIIRCLWFKIQKIDLGAPETYSQLHLVPSLSVFDHFLLVVGQFSYWEMYSVCGMVGTQTQLPDQTGGYEISHGTCNDNLFWFYSHQHSSGSTRILSLTLAGAGADPKYPGLGKPEFLSSVMLQQWYSLKFSRKNCCYKCARLNIIPSL